ncbi:MAG: hypothetical protein IKV13_07595 [Akkermansia sp.]|nr:hypothetical protein [Akkermansia sp.]
MKRLLLVLFVSVWCALPPVYGGVEALLTQEAQSAPAAALSPKARARVFPALAALPADTDSYFAVSKLGDIFAGLLMGEIPGAEVVAELDGFALGMSEPAVRDLERLMPLFQVLTSAESIAADQWSKKATPEAARAIVAQQREARHRAGELLVQASRDFHLAPIYVVLTCKPGSEALLHQLSVLPLMIPVEPDGPLVLMARGSSRGFYLRGDSIDLTEAELAPEHESEIARNLQHARLYVMAEVIGNKLVFSVCSNLDEVKLPRRAAQSLLGTPKMAAFDALMKRDAVALGSCSPAVVNMCEKSNLFAYRGAAAFIGAVFKRLGGENAAMGAAANAVEQMLQQLETLLTPAQGAEEMMLWREPGGFCMQLVSDAGNLSFAPGVLSFGAYHDAPDTLFFAESTPLQGLPAVNVPGLLQLVEEVQQAYINTLLPEYAEAEARSLRELQQARPGLEKLASGGQKIASALGGSMAVLVQEGDAAAKNPAFSLRAAVSDAPVLDEGIRQIQEAAAELELPACFGGAGPLQVQQQADAVLVSTGRGLPLALPQGGAAVQGGAVFSLNIQALAREMKRVRASETDAAAMLASGVKKLEGASTIRGKMLYTTLRVVLNKNN